MSGTRAIAFWLFVYLSISPLLTSLLVLAGVTIPFPVFRIFESAPLVWRVAFISSGILAVVTAYNIRSKSKLASLSAIAFLALFAPSFRVVFGHISFGILIAVLATVLAVLVSLKKRDEA